MPEQTKTFLELSQEERFKLVNSLQARRVLLRENSKKRKNKKGASKTTKTKTKPFAFDDPKMQAMFDMLPKDFKKKFGVKA